MAFFSRVGKSKLSQFSRHLKTISRGSLVLNHSVSLRGKPYLAEDFYQAIHNNRPDFRNGVRFFAAPIQFLKPKKEPIVTRINEDIKAEIVRLVVDDEHSVVPRRVALLRAKQLNLDLVEVNANANPPVCKLIDYRKDKLEKEMKEKEKLKEKNKSKGETSLRPGAPKEIRFSGKTEKKDLEMKALKITQLMEDGYKVKCTTKGAESDVLRTLSRLCNLIGDIAVVDSGPTLGKGSAFIVIRHIKYGQKKSTTKRLKDIADENGGILVPTQTPETDEKPETEVNGESSVDQINLQDSTITGPTTTPGGRDWVKNQFSRATNEVDDSNNENNNRSHGKKEGHPIRSESRNSNQERQSMRDERLTNGRAEVGPEESREQNRYGTRSPGGAGAGPTGRSRQGGFGSFSR